MTISDFKLKISDKMSEEIYNVIEESLLYSMESNNKEMLDAEINALALRIVNEQNLGWETQIIRFAQNNPSFIKIIENKLSSPCEDEHMQMGLINLGILFIDELGYEWIKGFSKNGLCTSAKYDLFSFLVSKNLEFAKELDEEYISSNFSEFINIKDNDIKALVDVVVEDENGTDLLGELINNVPFLRFELIEYIKCLLKSDINFNKGEFFLQRALKSREESVVQLAFDIMESDIAKKRMMEKYKYTISEHIYNSYINLYGTGSRLLENSLRILINDIREYMGLNEISFAARDGIKDLSENDIQTVYEMAKQHSKINIKDRDLGFVKIPFDERWDPIDYAYFLQEGFNQVDRNPELLAKRLGFPILVDEFETEDFEGCLIRHSSLIKPIIIVNKSNRPIGRVNFTIAHEIGHGILKEHDDISEYICNSENVSENIYSRQISENEKEANIFAKNLMLPEKMFLEIIENLDFNYENILYLSEEYGTSITLTAIRWVELSKYDLAIFYTIGQNLSWWWGSETFFDKYMGIEPQQIIEVANIYKAIKKPYDVIEGIYESDEWFIEESRYKFYVQSKCIYEDHVLSFMYIQEELEF